MKKLSLLTIALSCLGCVSGLQTLEGSWRTESSTTGVQSTTREILTYTFDEASVTRTLEWRVTSLDGLLSASLIASDTATYVIDESSTPARIDLSSLTQLETPNGAAFLSAAAISGQTERGLTLAFLNRADLTFSDKGLFELDNGLLQIRFGGTTDYPSDLSGAFELDRFSKLLGF
ncbi:MAG: hypothetical protein RLZZ303_166 [Candidatus Hydrogenedentota bacterium]